MTYTIITELGSSLVEGEVIKLGDYQCGVHDGGTEYPDWTVSELETGMRITSDLDKETAIKNAREMMTRYDVRKDMQRAKKLLEERGVSFPVNEI